MKTRKLIILTIILNLGYCALAQKTELIPDLSNCNDPNIWELHNRDLTIQEDATVHLNGKPGDGILWIKGSDFSNGRIELDIKGKDIRGRSFVGLAFHGVNDSIFDAVYFRPFNFKNTERNGHSIQYISHPDYTWYRLREEHPGKYENKLVPVPEPDEWFHATIVIEHPMVEVYVNNSDKPSLKIEQLSSRKKGWLGFWVGNNSEGYFKNLKINEIK